MKRLILTAIPLVMALFQACSSTPPVKGYEKDETLSTVNDSRQPDWADETKPFVIRSGKVYSIGVTTLRGSDRPEAGSRIAENNARANFSKAIENRMEFVFQNAEEGTDSDSGANARFIGSEISSLTSHSMTVEGHWWKRYAQSQEDGSRRIYYKVYSMIAMPESDLKKAIDAAINKVGDKKLSQSFQSKVDSQWDRFVEGKQQSLSQVEEVKTEKADEKPTKLAVKSASEAVKEDSE
jgi:hypothetical protein